jgi:hypothetical protein
MAIGRAGGCRSPVLRLCRLQKVCLQETRQKTSHPTTAFYHLAAVRTLEWAIALKIYVTNPWKPFSLNLFNYWQNIFQEELPASLLEQVKKFPED